MTENSSEDLTPNGGKQGENQDILGILHGTVKQTDPFQTSSEIDVTYKKPKEEEDVTALGIIENYATKILAYTVVYTLIASLTGLVFLLGEKLGAGAASPVVTLGSEKMVAIGTVAWAIFLATLLIFFTIAMLIRAIYIHFIEKDGNGNDNSLRRKLKDAGKRLQDVGRTEGSWNWFLFGFLFLIAISTWLFIPMYRADVKAGEYDRYIWIFTIAYGYLIVLGIFLANKSFHESTSAIAMRVTAFFTFVLLGFLILIFVLGLHHGKTFGNDVQVLKLADDVEGINDESVKDLKLLGSDGSFFYFRYEIFETKPVNFYLFSRNMECQTINEIIMIPMDNVHLIKLENDQELQDQQELEKTSGNPYPNV